MPAPAAKFVITAEDATAAAWNSALNRTKTASTQITGYVKTLFAGAAVGYITGAIGKAVEFGDSIGKAGAKAGLAARPMSELAYWAKQNDIEIDGLSKSIKNMQVAISEGASDNETILKTFRDLRVDFKALRDLAPDKQFEVLGQAIASVKDPADKARYANDLFKKSGAELLPAFQDGAKGIREAREEAVKFNAVLSDEQVKKLQDTDDAIKRLSSSWGGFANTLTAMVAPTLTQVLNGMSKLMSGGGFGSLNDQLDAMVKNRQFLIERVNSLEGNWLQKLILGSDFDATLADAKRQLAEVEAQMNAINAQAKERGAAAGTVSAAVSGGGGLTRSAQSDYSVDYMKVENAPRFDAFQYQKQLAKDTADFNADLQRTFQMNKDLYEQIDKGVAEGVGDTAKTAGDSIEQLGDRVGAVILKSQESAILAEEFTRSMFGNISGLLESIGEGSDNFAQHLLGSFKKILADSATRQLFEYLGNLGKQLSGTSGGTGVAGFFGGLLTSFFGGGKAGGGPLDSGKWYVAGEKGPEPIWGGGPGAFAAGYGGGSGDINIPIHIDARGATTDAVKLLPAAMDRAVEAAVAKVRDLKRRGNL